jgi:hypothetical protein
MFLRPILCLVLIFGFAVSCFAQQNNNRITAEMLKTNLYAKTPDEKKFCDYVIQKRDDGTIPVSIIHAVYRKALAQEKGRRFVYFKTALELVCKQRGIALKAPSTNTSPTTPSGQSFRSFFLRG